MRHDTTPLGFCSDVVHGARERVGGKKAILPRQDQRKYLLNSARFAPANAPERAPQNKEF